MRVNKKVIVDLKTKKVIWRDSFEYDGPIARLAYAVNSKQYLPPSGPVALQHRQTAADKTATTTVTTGGFGDLGVTGKQWHFSVKIKVKASTGTCQFNLEAADNTTFATNKVNLAVGGTIPSSDLGTQILTGFLDDTTQQYYRILATLGGTATFDVEVQATPIS